MNWKIELAKLTVQLSTAVANNKAANEHTGKRTIETSVHYKQMLEL